MSSCASSSLVLRITGDDTIRGMLTLDGIQVFSVYDFMTKACGYKDTGAIARKEFKRLTSDGSEHKEEIVASCHNLHFPGQRGPSTPCMTIRGLQRVLMILGGKVAAEFQAMAEGVFTRVMAGDKTLIEVINENAASNLNAPVQQIYRQALAQEPAVSACDSLSMKRKLDMEELGLQIDMDERRQRLIQLTAETSVKNVEAQRSLMDAYTLLCPNQVMDDRARLLFKDNLLNIATQGTPARAQNIVESGAGPSIRASPSRSARVQSCAENWLSASSCDTFCGCGWEGPV